MVLEVNTDLFTKYYLPEADPEISEPGALSRRGIT